MNKSIYLFLVFIAVLSSCRNKETGASAPQEDLKAKQMLQGIWINDGDQDVAFRVEGDTIYYPDSTSQPVYFQIFRDTFVIHGARDIKYPILRQSAHLFVFRNASGEEVRLMLSDNKDDESLFPENHAIALNQQQLIKRDTVVTNGDDRYHAYVQINPTSYKVTRTVMNDDGVAVDNFYYDNIINLHVYKGAQKIYSSDFRKQMFAKTVPADFLEQAVLSDMTLGKTDQTGLHFVASLVVPDTMSSYEVDITIGYNGQMTMHVAQ